MKCIENEHSRCDRNGEESWCVDGNEVVSMGRIQRSNIGEGPIGCEGEGASVLNLVKNNTKRRVV